MKSDKPVRDVNSVDLVRARHSELQAEIDTRQETFAAVIRTGEAMIENEHYAKDEVIVFLALKFLKYHKNPKYSDTQKIAVNILTFEQCGSTIE